MSIARCPPMPGACFAWLYLGDAEPALCCRLPEHHTHAISYLHFDCVTHQHPHPIKCVLSLGSEVARGRQSGSESHHDWASLPRYEYLLPPMCLRRPVGHLSPHPSIHPTRWALSLCFHVAVCPSAHVPLPHCCLSGSPTPSPTPTPTRTLPPSMTSVLPHLCCELEGHATHWPLACGLCC